MERESSQNLPGLRPDDPGIIRREGAEGGTHKTHRLHCPHKEGDDHSTHHKRTWAFAIPAAAATATPAKANTPSWRNVGRCMLVEVLCGVGGGCGCRAWVICCACSREVWCKA